MADTSFENKVGILSYLWMNYRDNEDWADFIAYNDLGLPLAYMLENQIVYMDSIEEDEEGSNGAYLIENTWKMLLSKLGLEDTGFHDIEEILGTDESDWDEDEEWEDPESDEIEVGSPASYKDGYDEGFIEGAEAEQTRVQEVIKMHQRWAKEKNRASEYMFWNNVAEVLTPLEIDYSEEAYRKSLENDGF